MNKVPRSGNRLIDAIALRDAALILLNKRGEPGGDGDEPIWINRHTPENPEPRLALCLSRHMDGSLSLNVWASLGGKHVKVLNIGWMGEAVDLVSFRRGEWDIELLALGAVEGIAVH